MPFSNAAQEVEFAVTGSAAVTSEAEEERA